MSYNPAINIKTPLHNVIKSALLIRLLLLLIALVIGFVILQHFDFKNSYLLLKKISLLYVLLFLILSLLIQFFKAISYHLLLKEVGVELSRYKTVKVFFASQVMTFLPGGEVGRVTLTKLESKNKSQKAASAVMAQVFVEIISALIVVLLGSLYFNAFRLPAILSLIFTIILLRLFLSEKLWRHFTSLFLKIKFLNKYETRLINIQKLVRSQIFFSDSVKINPSFLKVMLYAFVSHFVGGLLLYSISLAYGLNLNIFNSIFAFSASILIQLLFSIVPGGLGVTEGGLIGLLIAFGNSFAKSLALTLTFRVAGFLFNIIIGLILFIVFYQSSLKKKLKEEIKEEIKE